MKYLLFPLITGAEKTSTTDLRPRHGPHGLYLLPAYTYRCVCVTSCLLCPTVPCGGRTAAADSDETPRLFLPSVQMHERPTDFIKKEEDEDMKNPDERETEEDVNARLVEE